MRVIWAKTLFIIYSSDQGVCKGDSGGPMISFNTSTRQYFLLGVVSGGTDQNCGKRNVPSKLLKICTFLTIVTIFPLV